VKTLLSSIIIVGPTGSGKTPLGNFLQGNKLWSRNVVHFDFGYQLRCCLCQGHYPGLSGSDITFIKTVLEEGVLFEDDKFHIPRVILNNFLKNCHIQDKTIVLLNGLPRHAGQFDIVKKTLSVKALICLDCSPAVVFSRITLNRGGDRNNRDDDNITLIQRKLSIYLNRTTPIISLCIKQKIPIIHVKILEDTDASCVYRILEEQECPFSGVES
jgi:adenylate kinase family enzyme